VTEAPHFRSALYKGYVSHARGCDVRHTFRYRVCYAFIDLGELDELEGRLRLFGYRHPGFFRLRDADYGVPPGLPLASTLRADLEQNGIILDGGRIELLTQLRVLGLGFNPVSFFFCYHDSGDIACIVAEVNNTFGERRRYLFPFAPEHASLQTAEFWTKKAMHVSPFLPMRHDYRFRFSPVGESMQIGIDNFDAGRRVFHAGLDLQRTPISDAALLRIAFAYPAMPIQTMLQIHWEALRLYRKGAPFFRKPPVTPPAIDVKEVQQCQ